MPEIAPDLLQRLANYGLDERAIILLRETAPFVEPVIGPAMDFVIAGASKLSHIAELWRQHGDKLRRTEIRQFQALLRGEFDARYAECCRSTIEQQAALGFESRARMNCGAIVIKAASQIIARKYRYSNAVERAAIFSQAVMFDLATTETYYLATLEKAATLRRVAIDTAIADFDTAINGVLAAIKETSSSLIATSAIVQQVTNETGVRLHSAAGSSQETSNSVNIAVSSTSDMAASIQEIGQQTTRGLTMVRSALNDAERTKNTIRTLNEAAERIGSVVGLIAKIASHTNLLALNATIEAARAGEAGKGFAVVASEVKGLANQTSSATEDISQQVTAIQEATKGAVNEISLITQKINELAAVSASVASAIEEQEITTRQISSSFQLVLANTAYASNEIGSVELANKRSTAAVEEILAWTARLAAAAQDVDNKVGDFFARVRAA